jgi:hypothetical protein
MKSKLEFVHDKSFFFIIISFSEQFKNILSKLWQFQKQNTIHSLLFTGLQEVHYGIVSRNLRSSHHWDLESDSSQEFHQNYQTNKVNIGLHKRGCSQNTFIVFDIENWIWKSEIGTLLVSWFPSFGKRYEIDLRVIFC